MLTTSVERLEGNSVSLTVTVPASLVDEAVAKAYKAAAKKYRFPGFRPGKAPRAVIDNAVGREFILAEATEEVVNDTYPNALDAEGLRPVDQPEMDGTDVVEPGKEYTYVAKVDVRPTLSVSGIDDIAIEIPARETPESEIDLHVEATRDRFATLEPVEGRGIEAEDFVLLSFVGTVDGEPYEGNEVDKYQYEMGKGLMPKEFDDGIIGASAGEERRVEFAIPDTSNNPDFVGKTAGFDVTVHEIKAKVLPEVDDEFATAVGGFDSVLELRADLKTRLDAQRATTHDRAKERAVRELAASRLEGEVPVAMVDSRRATLTRDFLTMLEQQGLTLDRYLALSGVDLDQFEADMGEQGKQIVSEELALEAVFRSAGLEITDEDEAAEFAEIAEVIGGTIDDARERWAEMGMLTLMRDEIRQRKAVQWLIDNATITEVDEIAPEAE